MNYFKSISAVLLASALMFSSAGFTKECAWKIKEKESGDRGPASEEKSRDIINRKVAKAQGEEENPRIATLNIRKRAGSISPKETVELETLIATNNPRAAKLAVKEFAGMITEPEKTELAVLKKTGNSRQAFLVSKQSSGEKLSDEEMVEVQALDESAGDSRYSYLSVLKSKGEKLSHCDQEELAHLQKDSSRRQPASEIPEKK